MLLSFMERLKCAGYPSISLTQNSRMVERMARVTSKVFYQSTVVDHLGYVALQNPKRSMARAMLRIFQDRFGMNLTTPAIILNVPGSVCVQDPNSPDEASRYNLHHITATWKFLNAVLEANPSLDTTQMIVLTQYRSQADRYRSTRAVYEVSDVIRGKLRDIDIRTVDSFQNCEGRMVILDAVIAVSREGGPGFLTDRHRLNVATSCARDCFVLVVDMGIVRELQGDLRSIRNGPSRQVRADKDPAFLRGLLMEYRNSNSILDFPIRDDEIPVKGWILEKSMSDMQSRRHDYLGRSCTTCLSHGHRAEDCTKPGPERTCHGCNKAGHWIRDCPEALKRLITSGKTLPRTKMAYTPEAYMVESVMRID